SLDGVYCMGASYYETPEEREENKRKGIPNIGIGKGTFIRKAIIDQNARIGEECRIGIDNIERPDGDFSNYSIRDGIIVIQKNAIIPDGTIL
ncbi:MAG: glucose-1-phosphate adenylyltransferase, partial [Sphaerochaetaceae bacterium]